MKSKNTLLLLSIGTTTYTDEQLVEMKTNKKFQDKVKEIGDKSSLIITRDSETSQIFTSSNINSHKLSCASLFAIKNEEIDFTKKDYVLINLMKNGSNPYRNIPMDKHWDYNIQKLVNKILENHKVKIVSHSLKDYEYSKELYPNLENYFFKDWTQYLPIYINAYAGLFNRIHSSMINTSSLNPSVCLNTDSRKNMLEILKYLHIILIILIGMKFMIPLKKTFKKKKIIEELLVIKNNQKKDYLRLLQPYIK